jgi:hypothetical protein
LNNKFHPNIINISSMQGYRDSCKGSNFGSAKTMDLSDPIVLTIWDSKSKQDTENHDANIIKTEEAMVEVQEKPNLGSRSSNTQNQDSTWQDSQVGREMKFRSAKTVWCGFVLLMLFSMISFICAGAGMLIGIWLFLSASGGDKSMHKVSMHDAILFGIGIPFGFIILSVIFTCWSCKFARSLKMRS